MVSGQQIEKDMVDHHNHIRKQKKSLGWSFIAFGVTIAVMGYTPVFFTSVVAIGSSGYASYLSWSLIKKGWKTGIITLILSFTVFFFLFSAFVYGMYLGFI